MKKFLFVPLVLFAVSIFLLVNNYLSTGDFIIRDIDLTGGTLINLDFDEVVDSKLIEKTLQEKYGSVLLTSLKTSEGYGLSIQVGEEVNTDDVISEVNKLGFVIKSFTIQTIGPTLGSLFYTQVVYSLIAAFILMSAVIFVIYRNYVVSLSMIFATFANILTTLALANLFGIKISFVSLAALLMLIGYTIDSNIVLTHKTVKSSKENFKNEYRKALRTGLTLTATIVATMTIVVFLSTSKLLITIGQVLIIGFLSDVLYTWILNSSLLEMWIGKRSL